MAALVQNQHISQLVVYFGQQKQICNFCYTFNALKLIISI